MEDAGTQGVPKGIVPWFQTEIGVGPTMESTQTTRHSEGRVWLFSETSSYFERLRNLEVLFEMSLFRGLNSHTVWQRILTNFCVCISMCVFHKKDIRGIWDWKKT